MKVFNKLIPKKSSRFNQWFKDYLKNSSVAGCAYYVSPKTSPKERFFWLLVHVTSIILVVVMTIKAFIDYISTPTVTTEDTRSYPVQNVDFPGIAICDVNTISYQSAVLVAEEIMENYNGGNFTRNEITEMLKYLGHLYLFELNAGEEAVVDLLHKLLTRKYKTYVPKIVKELSRSPCRRMLKYCSWDGKEQSCEDIFFTRPTGDGYCCTFNYARPSDDFGGQNEDSEILSTGKIERSRAVGLQYGLTILLEPELDDQLYKILPVLGFKILIFSASDYPDAPSGGLREILVSPRTESSLTLRATTFYSVEEVSRYSVAQRDCLFINEHSSKFGGYYSYSDCIMYCRIHDMLNLCGCVPFFYPIPMGGDPVKVCNLQDLQCLKKYKNRWWRVKPRYEESMEEFNASFSNLESGVLECGECLPACTDFGYQVSVSSAPLNADTILIGKTIRKIDNHSIVNIFFNDLGTIRLKQDVMFYWYELMSNFGGICSFFLGISLISIVELFYFFTLRLYKRKNDKVKKKNNNNNDNNSRFTFVKAAKPSLQPLYWHEMIQPNAKY